ncbi:MAG: hypothetical protein ACO1N7_01080 [Sphingobacteriaceae bacterium]
MSSKQIINLLLAAVLAAGCKKTKTPDQNTSSDIYVLGYTQNGNSQYETHHIWNHSQVTSFSKFNVDPAQSVEFGYANGDDIYLVQQGNFWKNNVKTELFTAGGTTANVAYRFYQNKMALLIRQPSATLSGFFDYSIKENGSNILTVVSDDTHRYEIKDFIKAADTYYLLGYNNSLNIHPLILAKNGNNTTTIDLTFTGKNFQPQSFHLEASKFFVSGYVNSNGVLHAALMVLNTDGSNKTLTELNIANNSVLSKHVLVDGNDVYLTGWEPKTGEGSYYAFYLKNNQKYMLSNQQSRAMQIIKHNNDIYIAGLEWGPNLMYKIWKNGQFYSDIKTIDNKPILPLQLFAK